MEKIETPNAHTIEELVASLGMEATNFAKTIIYKADDKYIAAMVRGDRDVNEVKLKNLVGCTDDLELAEPAVVREITRAQVGFAGPVDLGIPAYADKEVAMMKNFVVGANETDMHYKNVNIGRDFEPDVVADIRVVVTGDACPKCGKPIKSEQGIEVGHIFKLGTKYSDALGLKYLDENSEQKTVVMGCYGIGVTRCLAAAVEQLHDDNGIIWPVSIAPYEAIVVPANYKSDEQMEAYQEFLAAKAYQSFAIRRRDSKNITSTLKETHPMLEISPRDLDADCFLLCTPEATYDLRKGMVGAREHSADDFITKITSVSPGSKGAQLWQDNLDLIFQKDQQLIDYVQMICGLAAIGKVFVEALIIAYGDGRNGKSTFWNAISRVLGLYSGNISADTLTVGCRRNIKPEMAEVKGKRLLIAAEMQEGARLNDSTVKQLCSTDDVFAEKKYKDPFSFKPCHTLVLYTNHLPRVSASDDGIWRRLIVIPFNAKIEGKADIKNYGEYLYENAGESILAWIIEGAKKVIALDYQIPVPDCVTKAIDEYRSQNDWFGHFLDEKCDVDESFKESSSALYQAYRNYSLDCNEYVRSTADFYFALEKAGFERLTLNRKRYFKGLKIHEDSGAEEDFLQ